MSELKFDVQLLADAFQIVETSINRGTFTAPELLQIMPVYQLLRDFLHSYQTNQPQEKND
jgi:hypothetical protein